MAIIDLTIADDVFDDNDTANTINGLAGADDIEGRGGDDILNGGAGDDFLKGDGGDTYTGPSGDDTLIGGAGNDTLRGGAGVDTFDGGADTDRVTFFSRAATAGVTANLATGIISNDGFGNAETMVSIEDLGGGTAFVDRFTGDNGANLIIGGIGDIIDAAGGADRIELDGAAATLDGGAGVDTIIGFTDRALVVDGADPDTLADVVVALRGVVVDLSLGQIVDDGYGNSGALISIENVSGGALDDDLIGGNGANVLDGGDGDDNIEGRGGADTIVGGAGDDFLKGDGNDAYNGPSGADNLSGGAGDDVLRGGAGIDVFDGGVGDDRVSFFSRAATQGVIANLTTQTISNDGFGNAETMTGIEGLGGGTAFVDTFTGNARGNTIVAGIADIVRGQGGDDIFQLEGATGTLDGGAGNDTIESFAANATVADNNADGLADDLVATAGVIVNLGAGAFTDAYGNTGTFTSIENVGGSALADTLTGSADANTLNGFDGADTLVGGGGADVLHGGTGRDRLDGGLGADVMIGGGSSDTYVVNSTQDVVVEASPLEGSSDTVEASISYTLGIFLEELVLTGASAINGTGNGLDNTLTGNSANNTLDGGAGVDAMTGGAGNDTYIVDDAGDVVTEVALGGTDKVSSSVTWTLGAETENLTLTGASAINGVGNALANTINGNDGANTLNGAGGADTLNGGRGNDILTGGVGADNFVFNAPLNAAHSDTITDFNVAADTIRLENNVFTALTATGALASAAFRIGPSAGDASDRIIYHAASGALYYDSDGNGAAAQIQIATLQTGLALTNADFLVI
ncbi:MAG: calcium-binding protein [Hyphomonadaceae bacterium]|nr:calcium-binding protein [Hyphomonadaceae bacterium]